jgi:hypothetical protein
MLRINNIRPLEMEIGINLVRFHRFLSVARELEVIFVAATRLRNFFFFDQINDTAIAQKICNTIAPRSLFT